MAIASLQLQAGNVQPTLLTIPFMFPFLCMPDTVNRVDPVSYQVAKIAFSCKNSVGKGLLISVDILPLSKRGI